jgi:hypothetical protein
MAKKKKTPINSRKKGKRSMLSDALKSHDQVRVRLYPDELETVNNFRRIHNEAVDSGINPKDVKHGWIKSDKSSLFFKNPNFGGEQDERLQFTQDLIKLVQEHKPSFEGTRTRREDNSGHLLVIDPADVHIGKLATAFESGEDYNSQIAVQRVFEGVNGILNKSKGFNIDRILFVAGNDILHIDTPNRKTTNGTPQDTDGTWYGNFIIAKRLYIEILTKLSEIANVHFVYNPSNHDYMSGFMLAQLIETYFENHQRMTFDCSIAHRKYYTYHQNLIGTTHGDGAKSQDLPLLMAHESKDWSNTKHRYIYTHHVHHKTAKDHLSVCVESLRSPSGTDSWHHRQGYQHAPKAIEGYIHSKEHGQVCRITHLF